MAEDVVANTDLLAELESNSELAMLVSAPPIAFNPLFVDITGSVTAALLLSVCAQDAETGTEDGWVELSVDRLGRLTRMSAHEQRTARRVLSDLKLMDVRRQGFPAKSEYRVNFERLTHKVLTLARNRAAQAKAATQSTVH